MISSPPRRDVDDEDLEQVEARRRAIESIAVDGRSLRLQAKHLPVRSSQESFEPRFLTQTTNLPFLSSRAPGYPPGQLATPAPHPEPRLLPRPESQSRLQPPLPRRGPPSRPSSPLPVSGSRAGRHRPAENTARRAHRPAAVQGRLRAEDHRQVPRPEGVHFDAGI